MKYLLVLSLVVLLLWLLYRRLRPYIKSLRQFVGVLKSTYDVAAQANPELQRDRINAANRLVRCSECGTWIPSNRALNSNAASYCSSACLDKTLKVGRRKAAS